MCRQIFLRELISNASDALDKIRLLSLTEPGVLDANPDMSIRIKAEPEARLLHISDSGVGMTRHELVNNLGTIAKSGTADFLSKMQDADQVSGPVVRTRPSARDRALLTPLTARLRCRARRRR